MEKLSGSKVLFFSAVFLIIVFPLSVTNYFFSANDLVKSSVIFIIGGIVTGYSFALVIYYLIAGRKAPFVLYEARRIDLSVLLLLLTIVMSAVFSLRPLVSFWGTYERQVGLITYFYLTLLYFIFGSVFNDEEKRVTALQMIEIISVIISAYAIAQFLNYDIFNLQPGSVKRPGSFLGYSVFLGGFLAMAFPFSLLNTAGKKNRITKVLFPFAIFAAIVVSGTRSAYLAVLVQFTIILLINRKLWKDFVSNNRIIIIIIFASTLALVYLFLFILNDGVLYHRITGGINIYNPRFILWKDSFNIFYKYPLTGPGIAMFPAALEEFYSNALRYSDANVTYDHSHNNYLQALFTIGLAGFIAYILLIYNSFYTAVKNMKLAKTNEKNRIISFAVILMLAGYCAYGLTNFDDISILFLLVIFLSILRSLDLNKIEMKAGIFKISLGVIASVFVFLSAANIPNTISKLKADRFYKLAYLAYNKSDFKEALQLNNEAINLNPGCDAYRYFEAAQVYSFCSDNDALDEKARNSLLKQVESEIEKVKSNLYYVNYCNGILSLVYFEEGRTEEAEKLKNEVLQKDSININYRIKLTKYLLKENRIDEAGRSLKLILLMRPDDTAGEILAAMYYRKLNDGENAVKYSEKVLQSEPGNKIAEDILSYFKIK